MSFKHEVIGSLDKADLNAILVKMVDAGGSDIFIRGNDYVRMSIHGRKEIVSNKKIRDGEISTILSILYGENAKSLLGSRTPIDTRYEVKREIEIDGNSVKQKCRFRVNIINYLKDSNTSTVITLREIPSVPKSARKNGVEEEILKNCSLADQGLILVVGATGNGKSTLLSGIIVDQLEDSSVDRNIITIESPIETVYDEIDTKNSFITQLEVGIHCNSFAEGARNTLRMAPNTVIVGEARDHETISAAVELSMTGHVVFSTVHANSVAETFPRLINAYPPDLQHQARGDVIQVMKMIIAQRLIRSTDGKRVAIREYLILDQAMKDRLMVAENISIEANRLVDEFGRSMIKDASDKHSAGRISDEEFERVKSNYGAGGH